MKKNLTLEEIYDLALQYHKKENYIDAINLYNKILEIEPNHFGSIVNLGVVLSTIEKYDLAKPLLEKAIEINSNNVDIYHYLGIVHYNLNENQQAKNCFEKIIEINPNNIEALHSLGTTFKKLGENHKAKNCFEKIIEIDPKNIRANTKLGKVYCDLGKYDLAVEKYSKILEIEPKNIDIQNNLITILEVILPKKNNNPIIIANDKLKKISNNFTLEEGIKKLDLAKLIKKSNMIIKDNINEFKFDSTQIYRRNPINLNCKRHFKVFNKFKIIPKFCFNCFKIQIEPENIFKLFKLFFIFDKLKILQNNTRKCMIETRSNVLGSYKGFIYCSSTDEANEIVKLIAPILNKHVIGKIKIKRGCSEFGDAFPNYKEINKNATNFMKYNNEWKEKERIIDIDEKEDNLILKNSLSGLSISDLLIMNNWLNYAKKINDFAYKDICEDMFYSDFISKIMSKQLDIRKKEFLKCSGQ